jgi:2-methylcitrate dehydratase PrpD
MGITNDYVDFCLGLTYEELPSEVVEYVKKLGLDFVGTAAYGTLADSSKTILEYIQGLNVPGDCTVIGISSSTLPWQTGPS